MARTVRGKSLESRTARLRLKPRAKPYYVASARPGLHLGYRRLEGKNGSWIARRYQGRAGTYEVKAFAQADDYSEADETAILTYYDAMQKIGGEAPPIRHGNPYTIREAVDDYVAWLGRHRKSARAAEITLRAYVLPYFADRLISTLTPHDLERWIAWALTHKPAGRRTHGKTLTPRKIRPVEVTKEERERRKKSTLNRVITTLKAALNHAFNQKRVASCDAWAHLNKFRGVDAARMQRLTPDQATRLCEACEPDFRCLAEAALLTGCRYGELCAMRACDYDASSGTLLIAQSKSAKSRRVPLTEEGKALFASLAASKADDDLLLVKNDGSAWGKSEQARRMKDACAAAKIRPVIGFHALRHSYASILVEAGTPLAFVAEALGHTDTRMVEKHYSHLAPNYIHDAIRANLPRFGVRAAR